MSEPRERETGWVEAPSGFCYDVIHYSDGPFIAQVVVNYGTGNYHHFITSEYGIDHFVPPVDREIFAGLFKSRRSPQGGRKEGE